MGTRNYSWVDHDKIDDFSANREKYKNASKTSSFKKAVDEMDTLLKLGISEADRTMGDSISLALDSSAPSPEKKIRKRKSSVEPDRKNSSDLTEASNKVEKKNIFVRSTHLKERSYSSHLPEESILSETSSRAKAVISSISADFPEAPPLKIEEISKTLAEKNIVASSLMFGFIGLGKIGSRLLKNLMDSKHQVTIWDRTPDKRLDFLKAGAVEGETPGDVVIAADIVFCCVSDKNAASELVFGNCGVLSEITPGKSYVEMTSIDAETSENISYAITNKGGRYLEVRFKGSVNEAEEGTLLLMAAGDKSLYDDCASCFDAFSSHHDYFGPVGNAAILHMTIQSINAVTLTGLCDLMSVSNCYGMDPKTLIELYQEHNLLDSFLANKAKAIMESNYAPQQTIEQLQKEVEMAIELANKWDAAYRLTRSANEYLKHAKYIGRKDYDIASVVLAVRSCIEKY